MGFQALVSTTTVLTEPLNFVFFLMNNAEPERGEYRIAESQLGIVVQSEF